MADNNIIIPESLTRAVSKLRTASNPNEITPAMEGGILADILAVLRRFEQVLLSIGDDGTIVIPPASGDGDNATHPYLTAAPDGPIVASALNSFAMWLLSVTSDVVNVSANGQGTYDGFKTTISADNTSHGIVIRKGNDAETGAAAIYTDATGVCPGLNADMLDGKHLNQLFEAMNVSGNTLKVSIGGISRTTTLPASSSGGSATIPNSIDVLSVSTEKLVVETEGGSAWCHKVYSDPMGESYPGGLYIEVNTDNINAAWPDNYDETSWPPITTNSNALCPNLHADLIDGFHANGLFQSMSVSGSQLSVKIGNTTRSITLPASSSSSSDLSEFLNYTYAPLNPSSKRGVGIFYNGELMLEFMSNACLPPSDNKMRMGQQDTRFSTFWVEHLYANNTSATSDMRLKDPVANLKLSINQIAEAPSFSFKWKDTDDERAFIGSSAQYWRDILPEAVCGEDEESPYLGLDYSKVAMAIGIANARAIRELCRRAGHDDIIDSLF